MPSLPRIPGNIAVFSLLTGLCLVLLSCGNSDNPSDQAGAELKGGVKTNYSIGGKTPEEAYKKFLYAAKGDCKDKSTVSFEYLGFSLSDLGTSALKHPIEGSIEIYLKADHTFTARYEEYEKVSCSGIACTIRTVLDERLSGTWSIETDQIVFSEIGTASYLTYNDRPAVYLTLSQEFVSTLARGKKPLGWMWQSNVGENDISINDYCQSI